MPGHNDIKGFETRDQLQTGICWNAHGKIKVPKNTLDLGGWLMGSNAVCREAARSLLVILLVLVPLSVAMAGQDAHKDDGEAPRMTVAELLARFEKHAPVVIVDSRSESSWEGSDKQIKGSIRIPIDQIEARMNELPKDKEIVIYCS
jgi:hypothetical protein